MQVAVLGTSMGEFAAAVAGRESLKSGKNIFASVCYFLSP
jgi:hypothetical protein